VGIKARLSRGVAADRDLEVMRRAVQVAYQRVPVGRRVPIPALHR
jgi:hypothetical protein